MSNHSLKAFNLYQKIHFIGIGGIGISALARILKKDGHIVTGTDQSRSHNTDLLISEGIDVHFGHSEELLSDDCDLVIYTRAIPKTNPELTTAQRKLIKTMSYPEAIGELSKSYDAICVCGTHGKTTTTAMLGKIMLDSGADPTVIVGSIIKDFDNKNDLLGKSSILVLEACEYQESFLNYSPKTVVLNNIEAEHLDYFKTDENYFNAFKKFLDLIPSDGILIANGDDQNIRDLLKNNFNFKTITFGRNANNDFILKDKILFSPTGDKHVIELQIPGQHNYLNASGAFIAALSQNINPYKILSSLNSFSGAERRFEEKAVIGETTIIDDYGHAPTEIQATLTAAKDKFGRNSKILCIFQPHQYSRTYDFLEDFAKSLKLADKIFIPNIYKSRDSEKDMKKINVDMLVSAINKHSPDLAENTIDFPTTINRALKIYQGFDAIICIGAGDITDLCTELVKRVNV